MLSNGDKLTLSAALLRNTPVAPCGLTVCKGHHKVQPVNAQQPALERKAGHVLISMGSQSTTAK